MAEGSNAFRNSLDLPREIHYFASLGLSLILVTDILHSMAFLFRRGICGSFSRIAPLVFSLFPFFSPALAALRQYRDLLNTCFASGAWPMGFADEFDCNLAISGRGQHSLLFPQIRIGFH